LLGLLILFGITLKYNPYISIFYVLLTLLGFYIFKDFFKETTSDTGETGSTGLTGETGSTGESIKCSSNYTLNDDTKTCDCVSPYTYDIIDKVCSSPMFNLSNNKFLVNIYTRYEERRQFLVRSNNTIGLSDTPNSNEPWLITFTQTNPYGIILQVQAENGILYNLNSCVTLLPLSTSTATNVNQLSYSFGSSTTTFALNKRKDTIFNNYPVTIFSPCQTTTTRNMGFSNKIVVVGPYMTAVEPTILDDSNPVIFNVLPKPLNTLNSTNLWYFEIIQIVS
jgi:hypothetical protein